MTRKPDDELTDNQLRRRFLTLHPLSMVAMLIVAAAIAVEIISTVGWAFPGSVGVWALVITSAIALLTWWRLYRRARHMSRAELIAYIRHIQRLPQQHPPA